MHINYLLTVLIGFLIGTPLVALLRKLALRYKILITQGIPLIGGVGMGLSFFLASLFGIFLYRGSLKDIMALLAASFIMLTFGVIDDWRELSILAKFLVQIIATSLLIFFGIRTQIVYIGNLLNIIITFIWIIGITNAFNHLDVIDGLAAGCATIVSFALFIVAFLNGDNKSAILILALTGAILSFLVYNFPPAKVYMGNSGSHFLGFILSALAICISYAPLERKIALFSPLFIFGFPIFDTTFLILMRIKQKRLIFKKSNDHLTLRILKLGYSKNKTLLFMLLLGLFFSLSGVVLSQVSNFLGITIIAFVVLASLIITLRMNKVVIDG